MKYCISILLSVFIAVSASAQKTVKMSAVKANDYGVAYSLPKTSIEVKISYSKKTRKAGQFYQYAERYLNVSNPITEDEVIYTLDNIDALTKGIADKSNSYLLEFKPNSIVPFVTLTSDGLICAINADYTFTAKQMPSAEEVQSKELADPNTFLSEEILRAGSTAKQAELIAKQIYRLRESRTNILTGEADNMPPDGDAYKLVMNQLDEQEKALTAMFIGSEKVEPLTRTLIFVPEKKDIDKQVICRFSSKLGIVEANDLSGAPIYMSLQSQEPHVEIILTPKEEKDLEKKFSRGVIYNVPVKGDLKITYNGKNYVNETYDIVQYGTQDVLTPQMFDSNKKPIQVIFFPDLGSIKQIIQ